MPDVDEQVPSFDDRRRLSPRMLSVVINANATATITFDRDMNTSRTNGKFAVYDSVNSALYYFVPSAWVSERVLTAVPSQTRYFTAYGTARRYCVYVGGQNGSNDPGNLRFQGRFRLIRGAACYRVTYLVPALIIQVSYDQARKDLDGTDQFVATFQNDVTLVGTPSMAVSGPLGGSGSVSVATVDVRNIAFNFGNLPYDPHSLLTWIVTIGTSITAGAKFVPDLQAGSIT